MEDKIDIAEGIWVCRGLKESDYDTLTDWWAEYDFPAPAREFLPNAKDGMCGLMLEDAKGTQYCAGFVYFTNSQVAWVEFIISNPEIRDKKSRQEMIRQLIRDLTYLAQDNGATWVFTSVSNDNLCGHFKAEGWQRGDDAVEMIKRLD